LCGEDQRSACVYYIILLRVYIRTAPGSCPASTQLRDAYDSTQLHLRLLQLLFGLVQCTQWTQYFNGWPCWQQPGLCPW